MIDQRSLFRATDEQLRRLLTFALDHDAAGPRLRQTPPADRKELIVQLIWLGVVQ